MKVLTMAATLVLAGPALAYAQAPAQAVPQSVQDVLKARHHVAVMEAVLERAVQLGAQLVGQRMQALTPNLMLFRGPARARGFRLEGYGLFFDVEVPALRSSVRWSIQALNEPDFGIGPALQSLRRHVQSLNDASARSSLEQALKRLELQVGPLMPVAAGREPGFGGPEREMPEPPPDPGDAYTEEVKRALVDAMLDHSASIALAPEEWLTVAARDNEDTLSAGDISEVMTIMLRIRGSDLAAFRADRLSRDEARKRVEVREF